MPDLSDFAAAEDEFVAKLRGLLRRRRTFKVDALADKLDVSPKRVREALQKLRDAGFRIPPEAGGAVGQLFWLADKGNCRFDRWKLAWKHRMDAFGMCVIQIFREFLESCPRLDCELADRRGYPARVIELIFGERRL